MWEAGDFAREGRTLLQENQSRRGPREARLGGEVPPLQPPSPSPRRPPQVPLLRKALDSITDPAGLGPSQASPFLCACPVIYSPRAEGPGEVPEKGVWVAPG